MNTFSFSFSGRDDLQNEVSGKCSVLCRNYKNGRKEHFQNNIVVKVCLQLTDTVDGFVFVLTNKTL